MKEAFCKRDLNNQGVLSDLEHVNENTQGKKLDIIRPTNNYSVDFQENAKVRVVALDYVGFTTSMIDLF